MPRNTKIEQELILLFNNKKGLETRLREIENELAEKEQLIICSKNDKIHSQICLLVSILLTVTVIVISFPYLLTFFSALSNSVDLTINPLFVVAFILHIINFILTCISLKEFSVILLLFTIPPFYIVAPFFELFLMFRENFLATVMLRQFNEEFEILQNDIIQVNSELNEINSKIQQKDVKKEEIHRIYLKAMESNDENLIIEAAKQGHVSAQFYLDQKQEKLNLAEGEKLYQLAIATNPHNNELMKKAAKLGNTYACIYFGKKAFSDIDSTMLTKAEKENNMIVASEYLKKVKDHDVECEFLWLATRIQHESNSATEWQSILNRIRELNNSENLPELYKDSITTIIESLVEVIDRISSTESQNEKQKIRKIKLI